MTYIDGWRVAVVAWEVGFRSDQLAIAIAVAKAESGWNTTARLHTSQEDSRGLWQINLYAHPQYDGQALYDGRYNARAAWQVYANSNHTWRPWTTYTRGTYQQFMNDAYSAIDQIRSMGYNPGGSGSIGAAGSDGTAPPVNQELHAKWDYTGAIDTQTGHVVNMCSDMQGNGNFIWAQIQRENI